MWVQYNQRKEKVKYKGMRNASMQVKGTNYEREYKVNWFFCPNSVVHLYVCGVGGGGEVHDTY